MLYNIKIVILHCVFMVLDLRLIKVGCRETTISYLYTKIFYCDRSKNVTNFCIFAT